MSIKADRIPLEELLHPAPPGAEPEPGYDEALEAAIAEGQADIAAGRMTAIEEIWKKLGLE